ncbi:cytochrome c [Nitrospiraceae bacterium AH_259_D15_M11_P09]|nr:cytochrome c [Nitrospiraceae bacterium AH_259_D15_M11_P09]
MTFLKSILIKGFVGIVVGGILVALAKALAFPPVFQAMFFIYAMVGAAVFILLDAPPLKPLGGVKAVVALVMFYVVVSGVYILGASLWPQYDPEIEKGKIQKLLKAKRAKALRGPERLDESLKQAEALDAKLRSLTARLNRLAPAATPDAGTFADSLKRASGPMTLVARGQEVYDLYECYNCHKIGGKGSVKKRGPKLDNVGNLLTIEDLKKKVLDPTYLYAEGFEKQHKKGQMPDKYKDLMSDKEVNALAAYMSTLKNPAVETPRPVFVKTQVEHGFIVYGYVRDRLGKPLPGVEVKATPLKKRRHAASAKANEQGYYEIFLHLHNEDAGVRIAVSAGGLQKEIVANYDPNDKVAKRQATVDFMSPS